MLSADLSSLLLLLLIVAVNSKPIDDITSKEDVNELDTGTQGDYKREARDDEVDVTEVVEVPRPFLRLSNDQNTSGKKKISSVTSTSTSEESAVAENKLGNRDNATVGDNASTRQQGFTWFLTPFNQKVQFSPQAFFQDKIGQLKDTLSHIGSIFPNQQEGVSKQFGNGGLVNLVGLNDSGFYTNRLDPVGFFGGNGWLANKGGILGGPGAFISTGSLLTDYPTPYRK